MNKVVYHNLGANVGLRNMYIRSTDIERKRWDKLLLSFPDEALFFLTKGYKIIIEDKCCKAHGKVQRIFAPVMTDFLRYLRGLEPQHKQLQHHLKFAIDTYKRNRIIKTKYDFFKKKLNNTQVRGRTVFCKTEPSVWVL